MAKFKYSRIVKIREGFITFFSNESPRPGTARHISRVFFLKSRYDNPLEEAKKFAFKETKPKQGEVWLEDTRIFKDQP